jgi:hypothetical protein
MNTLKELNHKFTLANPTDIPMVETDYYKWLGAKSPSDIHAFETKKAYLIERFNFVVGKSSIDPKHLITLKHIESYYFDQVIRPSLELVTE